MSELTLFLSGGRWRDIALPNQKLIALLYRAVKIIIRLERGVIHCGVQVRSGFHIAVCRFKVELEKILYRLANLIFSELDKKGCSLQIFADICGLHRNALSTILCHKVKDVKLSTIVKICENSDITYAELFGVTDDELFDNMIKRFYLTDGINEWRLMKSISK